MRAMQLAMACVVMLVASTGQQTQAGLMTLSTSDSRFFSGSNNQGWWQSNFANTDINDNYIVGGDNDIYRNFFTFDLLMVSAADTITSATLRLMRATSGSSNETIETLEFFDVSTVAATLNQTNVINLTIYDDLGSGLSYGEFDVAGTGTKLTILEFTLNAAAISDLNMAKGEFFSLGGILKSNDGNDFLFGNSSTMAPQTLVLGLNGTDSGSGTGSGPGAGSPIPEPSSMVLLTLGTIGLALMMRRRRKKILA